MIFQLIAVILLGIFYSCYFGKMIAQRRKGIQTDQIGKGKTGTEKVIELTMKAATLSVPVLELISICMDTRGLPEWARCIGIVLAISGDMVFCDFSLDYERQLACRSFENGSDRTCHGWNLSDQ